ncbi:MAG: hypothetical protein J5819_08415 [Eubacterium sp.]|nr:hypothetical protein [Eubacterium sp.]
MKKNVKKGLSALLIATMAFALTACGDDSQPAAADSGSAAATEAPATEAPATEEPATEAPAAEDTGSGDVADDDSFNGFYLSGGEYILIGTSLVVDEKNDDGTYFVQNVSDDGMLTVYQQGGISLPDENTPEEEYALNLATGLSETGANDDARIKPSNEYSETMTYPVYVASFTSGSNEDTRQWWVYITFSDSGVYLYGINTPADADPDAGAIADEVFPGLWMAGGE